MITLTNKLLSLGVIVLVAAVLWFGYLLYDISFHRHHYLSGWLLFYLFLAQMFYYVQKKFGGFKLPVNLQWLTGHTEFGIVAMLILLVHVDGQLPRGGLGIMVVLCFTVVSLSGLFGLYIKQKYHAALLRRSGKDIVFEEIPEQMQSLHTHAEAMMLDCAASNTSSLLIDYYTDHLSGAFCAPSSLLAALCGNNKASLEQFGNIEKLMPYLNSNEATCAKSLIRLMRKKNNLDYHYAHQGVLKIWLFIHVPVACSLLVLVGLHIVLVFAFSGSG